MKNDNSGCFSPIFWSLVSVGIAALGFWFFMTVINSDMPDWLKYLILR